MGVAAYGPGDLAGMVRRPAPEFLRSHRLGQQGLP